MKLKPGYKLLFPLLVLAFLVGCNDEEETLGSTLDYTSAVYKQVEETIAAFPADSLTEFGAASLTLMREEEKLARDVYLHFYEKYGMRIFNNISESEATHTYAIKLLLDKYELDDPVTNDALGEFTNEDLAALFVQLTAQGDSSLLDALIVGATIEDLDINDLMVQSDSLDNQDILFVYDNLTRGSRNHMRAFYSKIIRFGGSYEAQFISQTLLDSIVTSGRETGNWYE